MTVTLGFDPGQTGAIAILDSYGELVDIHDMPVIAGDVSPLLIHHIVTNWTGNDPTAIVEQVHSMPKQGVASSFKFGKSYGIILGVIAANQIRTEHVSPMKWKRDMRVTADKETCRARAIDRWPTCHAQFARKKDNGRAEAALLALWWHQRNTLVEATA